MAKRNVVILVSFISPSVESCSSEMLCKFSDGGMTFLSSSNASLISFIRLLSLALAVFLLYLLSGGGLAFGFGCFGVDRLLSVSILFIFELSRKLYSRSLQALLGRLEPLLFVLLFWSRGDWLQLSITSQLAFVLLVCGFVFSPWSHVSSADTACWFSSSGSMFWHLVTS